MQVGVPEILNSNIGPNEQVVIVVDSLFPGLDKIKRL